LARCLFPMAVAIRLTSFFSPCPVLILHSHTTSTFHPIFLSERSFLASRRRVACIFGIQYSFLLSGGLERSHPWPCQKQPLTWTTTLAFLNTMSGAPGMFLSCNLNRSPSLCNSVRTALSGFVFLLLTLAIARLRTSGVKLSTVCPAQAVHWNPRLWFLSVFQIMKQVFCSEINSSVKSPLGAQFLMSAIENDFWQHIQSYPR